MLLADAADRETRATLWTLREMRQIVSEVPMGGAACFNRLAGATDADLIVLLESGVTCLPPRWIELLVAALDGDPTQRARWSINQSRLECTILYFS